MSNDFWARKLNQPQQQPRGIVVQQPQQPQVVVPPGYQLVPIQPQQQQVPPGYQLVPQQPAQPAQIDTSKNYQQFMREHDGEKISQYWQGGEARRREGHLQCPQCGDGEGYTEFPQMGTLKPAPHCLKCGYNGKFTQGLQSTWVAN